MDHTGEARAEAERYLRAADGNLQTAVLDWVRAPSAAFDFDSVHGKRRPFLSPAMSDY